MSTETKTDVSRRMARVAGQVAGIQRMVEDDRYCIDVISQIAAVRAALGKVGQALLANHLETCVRTAFTDGDEAAQHDKIEELLTVFAKYGGK